MRLWNSVAVNIVYFSWFHAWTSLPWQLGSSANGTLAMRISVYLVQTHTHRHAHLTMLQFIVCLLLMAALVKFCQLAHAKHCGKCGWQFSALIKSQIQAVIAKCSPVPTCPTSVSPSLYLSLYFYLCVLLARPFEVVCLLQCMSFGGVESNPHYFSLKFINMLCLAFNILLVLSPPAPLPPAAT